MKTKLLIISMLISINVLSQEVKVTLSIDAISGDKSLFTEYWLNFGVDKSRGFLSGSISYKSICIFSETYPGNSR